MSESTENRARSDSAELAFRKIFIGGLNFTTDEEKLRKHFKQYGTVQDAVVMKDPVTKRSRGFGFVTFTDVSAVDNALANEPHTIDSRKVEAKRAVPRSEINRENGGQPPQKSSHGSHNASQGQTSTKSVSSGAGNASAKPAAAASQARKDGAAAENKTTGEPKINLDDYAFNKIFVGGLHYDTRDAEFRAYFEKYGKVISAEVMFNRETHKSRGFGFIVFETESSAVQVCTVKEHSIDGKVVEVKRAIPRSRLTPGTPSAQISPSMYTLSNLKPAATNAARPAAAATPNAPSANAQQKSTAGASAGQSKAAKTEDTITAEAAGATAAKGGASGAAPVTPSSRPVTTSTSYAAALKVGTAYESPLNPATGGMLANRDHPAPHLSNSGMNLMFGRMQQSMAQNAAIQRPSRSYSEPMVATGNKFEGSSSLNGDVVDEALLLNRASAGAITKAPSSNASSRSNSIVQAPSFLNGSGTPTLANIPWLSSPPSNPLDPTGVELGLQLPPAIEQKPGSASTNTQSNVPYVVQQHQQQQQNGPPGIVNNSGLWFPAAQQQQQQPQQTNASDAAQAQAQQQQQQAFQAAAMQPQYMGGPFGGMMFLPNPYMGLQPPPGVAPTPDVWAAMVSSHAMHEQMGLTPGQYPGQPFMMPQFPFFSPEAGAMAFGPGATPQQQMMFFNAQQQMQAMQMQHMQYQAQQAMAAQQAQLQQQQARNQAQGAQGSQPQGASQSQGGQNSGEQKGLGVGSFMGGDSFGKTGAPGLSPTTGSTTAATTQPTSKSSEHTESDDLFNLHGLNLDSPAFVPSGQAAWMPDVRR